MLMVGTFLERVEGNRADKEDSNLEPSSGQQHSLGSDQPEGQRQTLVAVLAGSILLNLATLRAQRRNHVPVCQSENLRIKLALGTLPGTELSKGQPELVVVVHKNHLTKVL